MLTEKLLVAHTGMAPEEARRTLEEARELAIGLEGFIPDIGILSLRKRLRAYLVVTSHITGLVERAEVSMDLAALAHSMLLSRSRRFQKCYRAFISAWRTSALNMGDLNRFAAAQLPQGL